MSVLVFLDESRWDRPEKKDYFATIAGVAIEEATLEDFSRRLMKLKGRFFKKGDIGSYPLRGRLLLNSRSLESYRKQEFIRELFSLCRLYRIVTFSTTRKCKMVEDKAEFDDFMYGNHHAAISNSDRFSDKVISLLLAYMIERINSYVLENHPGQQAKLVFKTTNDKLDSLRCTSVMNFIYNTNFGGGFYGLLGNPLFAPVATAEGLQLANLFSYIINQRHAGRMEMNEYFAEVESLQFISSVEQDEFQLRGMNLLE